MSKHFNRISGAIGEQLAYLYLKKNRYKILDRNYKNEIGEIDIIAKKKRTIVFIEVKARYTLAFGRPSEAVDENKQNKIRNVAMIYLMQNKLTYCPVRFDVIEIIGESEFNHIENAF